MPVPETAQSTTDQHADLVAAGERFEFGVNWKRFLSVLDDERIAEAEVSLRGMLDRSDLEGVRFLDVGSGSGLFSLAARRLGAQAVRSFDFDPNSVECTAELRRRYFADDGDRWVVGRGSALDEQFLAGLGTWDIVYSWGVLHHTGDMWRALDLVAPLVREDGTLFISIYNDQGLRSRIWYRLKQLYNRAPRSLKLPYALAVMGPVEFLVLMRDIFVRRQPMRYVRSWTNYQSERGMSRWHDIIDWIGGYPFEVATPQQIREFFQARGFVVERELLRDGLGCNEFVLRRVTPAA